MVSPANSTVTAIRREVRHLTNSPGENSLTTSYIDEVINDIYNTDFPYGVKIDQMRNVYTIYTRPNIDRYPLDVNYNQGIRSPVYFDGAPGIFYKDRRQFFNLWPKLQTQFQPASGDGASQSFSFTIPGPFLSEEVMIGTVSTAQAAITIKDDGDGNLVYITPNSQTSVPAKNTNPALPGMYNENNGNPGLYNPSVVGSVNYVTGAISFNLAPVGVIPASGENIIVKVSQYRPGRPYCLLFFNNEFVIRPVPDKIYKVEIETFLTPVQFMAASDHPILDQWWKFLSYLASMEIQRRRGDFDSVAQLQEGAKRQEALVLERQGIEEIGTPNYTLFNGTSPNPAQAGFWWYGW